MTRIGRFGAAVGAIVVGVMVLTAYLLMVDLIAPALEGSFGLAIVTGIVGMAIFGITVGAMYTWTVDGPFVFRRNRSKLSR
jgi:hypothetical protein